LDKDAQTGRAMYRGARSIGITASCRASFIVGPDPDNPGAFVFACIKLNGAPKPRSIRYQVVGHTIEGDIETQRIKWGEKTDQTADQLVGGAAPGPRGPVPEKLEAAIALLHMELDDGRWHPSKPIIDAAKARDISYNGPWKPFLLYSTPSDFRASAGSWPRLASLHYHSLLDSSRIWSCDSKRIESQPSETK
jgi:hypothetical protein